ncbi:putative nucleic acid-binding Zn-ribbon protein [Clostridium algifaecis]|uniref:Nucleic acid-binding Zn-ribbon protein n=1 Tax=Clostridium algifaecis TaxID=1472040 RepID=A0ABS4KSR4_9CLOT|nr:C4-type zinc ribbon domain-containing protein [Clostridium algifaecis]MBP2033057.1 putative nucleic acid-binding Zn-ribbon protein [Clostridium algifaecis]
MLNLLIEIQKNKSLIKKEKRALKTVLNISVMKDLKKKFDDKKIHYIKLDKELKGIRKNIEITEKKINEVKDELEKDENKLYSNLKYDLKLIKSLEKSIESKKDEIKNMEDKSLEFMYEEEKISSDKKKNRKELVDLRNKFYEFKENGSKEILKVKEVIEKAEKDISNLEREIPEELLDEFNEISEAKGTGAAELYDGVCTGCKMKVSAITIDNIKKNKKIVYCDNCGRIVHCKYD